MELEAAAVEKENDPAAIEDKIEAEVVREASIHSKRSRTQTAIDREKL